MAYSGSKSSVKAFLSRAKDDRKITVRQAKKLVKSSYKNGKEAGRKSAYRNKSRRS